MVIYIVAGTRPEIVKLAPVYRALKERAGLHVVWVATGQHSSLADQAHGTFEIVPDLQLDMPMDDRPAGIAGLLGLMLQRLDAVMAAQQPDFVVVQGDTTSAAAAALAAFGNRIPCGHVEAGLRTHDRKHPFPEEAWRGIIGRIADLHFAPTQRAADNLLREAVPPESVTVTGNTVIDALHWLADGHLPDCRRRSKRSVLVTLHRRENWGEPLERVSAALCALSRRFTDTDFRFVAHANPHLRRQIDLRFTQCGNVQVLDPMDYAAFIAEIRAAALILTDSGGIQEEAPAFGVPVLVLRDATERPEAVEAGVARLVGSDAGAIAAAAGELLGDEATLAKMARIVNPFGDGKAAGRITERIELFLAGKWPQRAGSISAA